MLTPERALSRESAMIEKSGWRRVAENHLERNLNSEAETKEIGGQIAHHLRAGDVIALIGELGAGKTRLVKAIAAACGVPEDEINSPTFTLIHEYQGRCWIRHCDTYRLRKAEEFAELGLDELFANDGIALIEWADRVESFLPTDRLEIRISLTGLESRSLRVVASGGRSSEILGQLAMAGQ